MAGFGSLSLAQTVVGTLLDQRVVVLYKQPKEEDNAKIKVLGVEIGSKLENDLWGKSLRYEELFAGIAEKLKSSALTKAANITGTNPYGITYISAKVNKETDLCDHPIETGKILTDARVTQPVTAQVEVAMPTFFAERIYTVMNDYLHSTKDKIILQTKYNVYKNLVLQSFSYALDNKTVDRTIFTLTLREIMEVKARGTFKSSTNIKKPSDTNTISNGTQVAGV